MTPAEYRQMVEGFRQTEEAEIERLKVVVESLKASAWLTAYLQRVKRFPSYQHFMVQEKPPKSAEEARQDWEELKKQFH